MDLSSWMERRAALVAGMHQQDSGLHRIQYD
jgi:hypothetical protein